MLPPPVALAHARQNAAPVEMLAEIEEALNEKGPYLHRALETLDEEPDDAQVVLTVRDVGTLAHLVQKLHLKYSKLSKYKNWQLITNLNPRIKHTAACLSLGD